MVWPGRWPIASPLRHVPYHHDLCCAKLDGLWMYWARQSDDGWLVGPGRWPIAWALRRGLQAIDEEKDFGRIRVTEGGIVGQGGVGGAGENGEDGLH